MTKVFKKSKNIMFGLFWAYLTYFWTKQNFLQISVPSNLFFFFNSEQVLLFQILKELGAPSLFKLPRLAALGRKGGG